MEKIYILPAITLIGLIIFQTNAAADNDKPISVGQLPDAAQQVINTHFSDKKVALAKLESDILEKSYDVVFDNGEKIEFDKKGNWTEIDCKFSSVPTALVPPAISSYVKSNYPETKILKIEKDRNKYGIELSNRIEITFNKSFHVIDID